MAPALIVFDFDGVVADSEVVANKVLARFVTGLGHAMSVDESIDRFMGKRIGEVAAAVERLVGRSVPGFADELQQRTFAAFRSQLREVAGLGAFLARHRTIERCIASSSTPSRIRLCIDVLGLNDHFGAAIFSAEAVRRGKPFPDIFLHAAAQMRAAPKDALVIEDSASGVEAAVAAGMRVVGLLAGGHVRPGHARRLRAAGATFIAHSYAEVSDLLSGL